MDCPTSFVEHYSHANLTVRRSNIECQKEDWEKYLKTWEGIFYNPDKNNIGDWIYMHYENPHRTAEIFKGLTKKDKFKYGYMRMKEKAKNVFFNWKQIRKNF